ncbi:MAG: tRNA 2-thiouridine(34) synthase MnmA [Dehalococcoidia bacterium]|nr:tRNA 2-thiouridine(34) synthase MnmA [Dehalococcoidia bacterium]
MTKGKVVVAMSGGVDSAVAAALLHSEGYDVVGITMRLWTLERDDIPAPHRTCCSVESVEDAQRVCEVLGIPHYFMNFERPFKTHVVDYFTSEYARGRTPNPCLACNQYVKFDALMDKAVALGAEYLATGHYARIAHDDGGYRLLRAIDPEKDQSYVLYTLTQEEMKRLLLPIGGYLKPEIRKIAGDFNLPLADKPDSQDICFVPDRDYKSFVAERVVTRNGPIVDISGKTIGTHKGIINYTVGQRHGLGIASPQRLYVLDIDAENNTVIVGSEEDLLCQGLIAEESCFISGERPGFPMRASVKLRYRAADVEAELYPSDSGRVEVRFIEPQRAVSPGQAAVFYQGDEVIGGGTIARSIREFDPKAAAKQLVAASRKL